MKVYRILTQEQWNTCKEVLPLSEIDIRDGYIHMSTQEELLKTANLYFLQEDVLVILSFEAQIFGAQLKMEFVSSRNAYFPHLYAEDLLRSQISEVHHLQKEQQGFLWRK